MQQPPVGNAEGMGSDSGEFKPGAPLSSLWSVTRGVLLPPRRFFGALPPDAPADAALLYFLICFSLAVVMTGILALVGVAALILLGAFEGFQVPSLQVGPLVLLFVALPVLAVAASMFLLLAGVPVQHAIVVLVTGGAHRGLRATARAFCYAAGATLLLGWIPLIGVLAALYGACVYAIGLRRLHGLPPLRAGAALLIPAVPSLAVAVVISVFAYNATRTLAQGPASYYFPPPEAQKDLPPAPSGLWR